MKKNISLVFTGDIGFDKYMDKKWEDENFLSDKVAAFLRSGDHLIVNVEGAMTQGDKASLEGKAATLTHSMNPAAAGFLEKIGADIWNICNNHIMDAGAEGVADKIAIAAKHGAKTIGAGMNEIEASEPVYLEEAGGIGMFGVAYMTECIPASATEPGVFRWDDLDLIAARIAEVKARCRWCIVVAHGGEEFADLPNPYTRNRYLKYLELGADVVVAHHPHVPENYDTIEFILDPATRAQGYNIYKIPTGILLECGTTIFIR